MWLLWVERGWAISKTTAKKHPQFRTACKTLSLHRQYLWKFRTPNIETTDTEVMVRNSRTDLHSPPAPSVLGLGFLVQPGHNVALGVLK